MTKYLPYAATAVFGLVVLVTGILHGLTIHRWQDPPSLEPYIQRLHVIPMEFGTWSAVVNDDDQRPRMAGIKIAMNERTGRNEYRMEDNLEAHGVADYILRIYRSPASTDVFQVLVVCGRHGPIAAHTPDVCYRGSGFIPIGEQKRADVVTQDRNGNKRVYPMFQLKFAPPRTRLENYEKDIRWAWIPPGGGFSAPERPRIEFATEPALYKIYIIHDRPVVSTAPAITGTGPSTIPGMTAASANQSASGAGKFLEEFLPLVDEALREQKPGS